MSYEQGCPWRKGKKYTGSISALSQEVSDFYDYLCPTDDEIKLREKIVEQMKHEINQVYPKVQVRQFGSSYTRLCLPDGDVDMMLLDTPANFELKQLVPHLLKRSSMFEIEETVDSANVPLIKMFHKASKIKIDIALPDRDGIKNSIEFQKLINEYQDKYPDFPKLVLVIKMLLKQKELNIPVEGGLSSKSLMIMVIAFLKNVKTGGQLLMEFLKFYANFDFKKQIVSVDGAKKVLHQYNMYVEDPLQKSCISVATRKVDELKELFKDALNKLTEAIKAAPSGDYLATKSILGCIVKVPESMITFRENLRKLC